MIDLAELKALVEKARARAVNRRMVRPIGGSDALPVFLDQVADTLLALSDEVERIKGVNHTACQEITAQIRRAEAAESEAQALRERMGEIGRCAFDALTEDGVSESDALTRIAALSTTPKEKEG